MSRSPLLSIFGVLSKLQEKFSSTASSSHPFDVPKTKKLNDMVYEVHSSPPKERPELEIVFFHGLQVRHSEHACVTTWMTRDNSQLWLQTWLVELFPKARILTISYDSSAQRSHESGRLDMYCTGENLVSSLTADEVQVGQAGCPVVLVGHCLGGLVLKELCLSAAWMLGRKSHERFGVQRVHNLFSSLRGMFFYGTPHTGSLLGDELNNYFKGALLEEIETMKASSARRNQDFNDLKSKHRWLTSGIGELYETYVECLGKYIHVVPEASTRPYMDNYYSAAADHYDICRPQGKNGSTFVLLKDFLKEIQNDGVLQARAMADSKSSQEYLIDLEGRASQVRSMLAQPDTDTIFIVGPSGIGKTTLAQQVFHHISYSFPVTCFVSLDSVEAPSKSNCEEQVLRKIQDALAGPGVSRGSNRNFFDVLSQLKGRRVLLVVDNLDFKDQLAALHTETWLTGTASKLIITTTNGRLGNPSNTFTVPYLSDTESRQLFNHYAFMDGDEPQDLRDLVSKVIQECENFPITLKVLGGYVRKENFHEEQLWRDLLDRLQKAQEIDSCHDYRIFSKLKLCYDTLPSPDQDIFLDIATLFHGFPFELVKCIWNRCRDSSHLAWRNLERGFIANVDKNGKIWMHRLLRNMGQSIACPQNVSIYKWTRISSSSHAKQMIAKHQGIVNTLALKVQVGKKEILTIKNTTFLNYVHLEYLILEGVRTSPGTLELPKSLVYLRWKDGLFTSCPVDFKLLEKLVVLELVDCKSMKFLPPSVVNASKLMWLELEGCLSLAELPLGLSRFLEHLGLNNTSLKNLPSDLRKFKRLRYLQANETHLTRVPQDLYRLEMLSSLTLSGTRLTTLPESVGNLRRLKKLDLKLTMVTSLPDNIGQLEELEFLDLSWTKLGSLPESIGGLVSLKRLKLGDTCVKSLPLSLGDVVNLETLSLGDTPLETLPDSICELRQLLHLELQNTQISRLPDAIGGLVALKLLFIDSPSLRVWSESTGMLSRLTHLTVNLGPLCENPALSLESGEFEGRGEENALAVRDGESQMGIHSFLSQLPLLHAVVHLELQGRGFPQYWFQSLFVALQHMPSLELLQLRRFNLVEIIPCELGTLTRLKTLFVEGFEILRELPESLGELTTLEQLTLYDMPKLCRLPESLSALPSLLRIFILGCASLQSMPRSFSSSSPWESESSTCRGSNCRRSDSLNPICIQIEYWVQCNEMEKVLENAIESERDFVIDTKVARKVLTKIGLHFLGDDNGLHGSRPCLSQSYRFPRQCFKILCKQCRWDDTHFLVEVKGLQEESDETEESNQDTEEEDNEALVVKYLRALWSFLLSSG